MEEGSERLPSAGELPQNARYTPVIFCSHLKLPHLKAFRSATRRKQPHLLKSFNQVVADSLEEWWPGVRGTGSRRPVTSDRARHVGWTEPSLAAQGPGCAIVLQLPVQKHSFLKTAHTSSARARAHTHTRYNFKAV